MIDHECTCGICGRGIDPAPMLAKMSKIICKVSLAFNVRVDQIKGSRQPRSISNARLAFYYLSRQMTRRSSQEIGNYVGGRDHSTVLSGIKSAERLIAKSPEFAALVEQARASLVAPEGQGVLL